MSRAWLAPTALTLLALLAGCSSPDAPPGDEQPARPGAQRAAVVETEPPAPLPSASVQAVDAPNAPRPPDQIDLADPEEAQAVQAVLATIPREPGTSAVSDQPIPEATRFSRSWVAVTGQRNRVLSLTLAQLGAVLSGTIRDWSELGGAAGPITVVVPDEDAAVLAELASIDGFAAGALRVPPGAIGLAASSAMRPGLLPLVLGDFDPLRDSSDRSPLTMTRWVRAGDAADAAAIAQALGWVDEPAVEPLGLIATGDFIPTRCVGSAVELRADGDFGSIFELVGEHLRRADLVAVSMEVSATDLRPPTPCIDRLTQAVLSAHPDTLRALEAAGVDVVTMAGNHSGDCNTACSWRLALVDTLEHLESTGLAHTGTGRTLAEARAPAILERDGVRLAFLSYDAIAPWFYAQESQPGTAPALPEVIAADVAAAAARADHVIVALSWGEEYVITTTVAQERIVDAALAAGASLIVGNHPHTLQPLIRRDGALVAYALGNFVFDQSWSPPTMQSVLLEVGFDRDRILGYRVRPVVVREDFQPDLVPPRGAEGRQVLERLWRATDGWLTQHQNGE